VILFQVYLFVAKEIIQPFFLIRNDEKLLKNKRYDRSVVQNMNLNTKAIYCF